LAAKFPEPFVKRNHLLAVIVILFSLPLFSQQLQLIGLNGKAAAITGADLKAMPRHSVTVTNPHTKSEEKYDGVLLSDLLAKVDAPMGEKLRGPAMLTFVKASASDKYAVVLALAEIDPHMRANEIIVADTMNGAPLDAHNGPLKLVVPGDLRPARSVRMLTSLLVAEAP
jgi:hypothetical protein